MLKEVVVKVKEAEVEEGETTTIKAHPMTKSIGKTMNATTATRRDIQPATVQKRGKLKSHPMMHLGPAGPVPTAI